MISFIIVNYQSLHELRRCLRDLSQITNAHLCDVIIVNNDTQKLHIPKYTFRKQKVYEVNENIGYARANNIGLAHATTDYICFLNPDTHSFDVHFTTITQHIDDTTIASPQILSDDGAAQQWSAGDAITLWGIIKNNIGIYKKPWHSTVKTPVHWVTGAALCAKKHFLEQLNGFDEDFFLYFEDVDLCTRAQNLYGDVLYIPTIQVHHSSGCSSKNTHKTQKECYYKSQDLFFAKHHGPVQKRLLQIFRLLHR